MAWGQLGDGVLRFARRSNRVGRGGASVGVRGGDEFLWIDNDFGKYFTKLVQKHFGVVCLRRFVDSTKHHRDAFLFRVSGKTKTLSLKFRHPVLGTEGDFGLRGSGQQAVITGIHPSTGKRYLTSIKIDRIEVIPEISPHILRSRLRGDDRRGESLWA